MHMPQPADEHDDNRVGSRGGTRVSHANCRDDDGKVETRIEPLDNHLLLTGRPPS